MGIEELIRSGEIEVYRSKRKKIEIGEYEPHCDNSTCTIYESLGSYLANIVRRNALVDHIHESKGVIFRGNLVPFLSEPRGVYALANFLVSLYARTVGKDRRQFHVDVDIEEVDKRLPKEKIILANLLGQNRKNATRWMKISHFERLWNIALCDAIGGLIGYPGYEWPQTAKGFECHVHQHATWYFIGNKEQLKRYEKYAKASKGYREDILRGLKKFG